MSMRLLGALQVNFINQDNRSETKMEYSDEDILNRLTEHKSNVLLSCCIKLKHDFGHSSGI